MKNNQQREWEIEAPPREFVKQVKDALEHLYDFPYLQCHPLTKGYGAAASGPDEAADQQLRSELMTAIEALSPGPGTPFRAPHARIHSLLQLRYIEGLTVREAAHELGLSERQAYRDLRRGEENVAAILWAHRSAASPPSEPGAAELSSIQVEMARLQPRLRPADISSLLRQAQMAIEPLASGHSVRIHTEMPSEPVMVSTDPVLALQILINVLSHAVQQAQPGDLQLELQAKGGDACLTVRYKPAGRSFRIVVIDQIVSELVSRLGWATSQQDHADGSRTIVLRMAGQGPTVLVIDDNEGLVQLLDRYLTNHACRVLAAGSGQEGLALAKQVRPSAIVLDVMMPGMDGWQLLQRLRAHPQTASTPVIICSVFNDPELAYSLGASRFLPKPVRRADILTALRELGVV